MGAAEVIDLSGFTFRPIDIWPGRLRRWNERRPSQFSASWPATKELLYRELAMLDARRVVVQLALVEADFRIDRGGDLIGADA